MDLIYLDNNATTPLLPAAWEAMKPFETALCGNPASAHQAGRRARQALEDARERLAALLGAYPDEVVFTSGATEANNLAIFGLVSDQQSAISSQHLITSPIEHPSVSGAIQHLSQLGWAVDRLPVDGTGVVRSDALPELLRPQTRLVSVMLANHETGAIQPITVLASQLPKPIPFHCDAVQAAGKVPVHFHDLGVTTLTVSAHKFHGPKGIGALLVRRGTKLQPRLHGGHQQQGRRPGTEAVALAAGMAAALAAWHREAEVRTRHVLRLRHLLLDHLRARAAPVVLNGPEETGVPHTLNLSFPGCRADALLMNLDLAGVACATGSACSSGSLLPSPILQAMGVPEEVLHSAMRFSLSPLLTEEEVAEGARRIAGVVNRLRHISDPSPQRQQG